jgi:hypothetical protein
VALQPCLSRKPPEDRSRREYALHRIRDASPNNGMASRNRRTARRSLNLPLAADSIL